MKCHDEALTSIFPDSWRDFVYVNLKERDAEFCFCSNIRQSTSTNNLLVCKSPTYRGKGSHTQRAIKRFLDSSDMCTASCENHKQSVQSDCTDKYKSKVPVHIPHTVSSSHRVSVKKQMIVRRLYTTFFSRSYRCLPVPNSSWMIVQNNIGLHSLHHGMKIGHTSLAISCPAGWGHVNSTFPARR